MMIASVAKSVVVSTNKRKKPLKVANSPPATLKHCDKCHFHSNDMNEFSEHMKFEHNMDEIYPCDLCSFYTQSLWDYQVHMEKTHRDQQMPESDNSEEIVDEPLVEQEREEEEEDGEEEEEDEEGDENKESILYSSSSSSSSSICVDPAKINTEQELNRNSLLNNNNAIKNQVINNDNKMLFDLANQYSSPNQLSQLIQKYNQHLSSQTSMCSPLPRLSLSQQIQNVAPSHEKTKRHYNSEVDPARYRKVLEDGITKFACSICGNTYKWRKSLNKHWKEKHITETPPPLDAPVAVKLRNAATQPSPTPLATSNSSSQCAKKEPTQLNNALNLFQHYLSSMTNKCEEMDALAPLDLSMKPKRERSGSPTASHRSNSASSSTSSSSNTSSSATSSSSSDSANHQASTACQPPAQHQQSPLPSNQLNTSNQSPQVYNQKLFICSVCDAKFHVVDQINDHFLKNHYNEYQRELSSKSPPRNTNVAQQNEEWNLSDPHNPLKCIKCDFVGRWPTELQKHAASHSTSRPFKCLICSLTYKWRWDLAKHFDRTHPTFRNPYKKRDRDAARSTLINPMQSNAQGGSQARKSRSRSRSNESDEHKKLNKYEQISINPNTPPLSSSSSSSSSTCSIQPPPPPPPPFMPPFMTPQPQNTAAMYAAYLLANPALLTNPLFAMAALHNTVPTGPAPCVEPRKKGDDLTEPRVKSSPSNSSLSKRIKLEETAPDEKESRNFQCFWCDFRGRWRSEIIQHMRCHHAREKPYRCSSCMYASNWKWDVQKHTKKQHPNATAKIVEIPDQVLFPDLKDLNFFDSIKPLGNESPSKKSSAVNLTPPSSSSSSSSTSSISSVASVLKKSALNCHQCPYVACNLSDLRRHLIVHSNEQPYHCCSCPFKSKWKSDVKKHQRSAAHIGPILVGKKAMQKVIETLGLDRRSELPAAIDVFDNRQCKSNEKLIDEEEMVGKRKRNAADDSEEELYEQLNDDEEYFDDDEEPLHTLNDNFEEEQFAHDESAELEIDQINDHDVDDEY